MSTTETTAPYGYCQCGCGEKTKPWEKSNRPRGRIKGEPRRYLKGHHARKPIPYLVEDCGYTSPCWIWQLSMTNGYGSVAVGRSSRMAHIVYYERATGSRVVRGQHHVHHRCEQCACVNPDHLEVLTPAEHKQLHSRLTWNDVRAIRARVAGGERRRLIADEFGLSLSGVDHIVQGNRWRGA